MNHQFVAVWDCTGLEYVCDVTEKQGQQVWNRISGRGADPRIPNLMHLRLRAQANQHRHYEIYLFEANEGITEQDIINMFENAPQQAADTIRNLGHCYYSDRVTSVPKIV
jgi:hypothetical protein